uniref:Movement protein n=1 Tax=Echinostoma caproni TaxID=27848 RepID=A0A183ATR9_9TREM
LKLRSPRSAMVQVMQATSTTTRRNRYVLRPPRSVPKNLPNSDLDLWGILAPVCFLFLIGQTVSFASGYPYLSPSCACARTLVGSQVSQFPMH